MRYFRSIADGTLHASADGDGYGADEWIDLGESDVDPLYAMFDAATGTVVSSLDACRARRAAEATAYRDQRIGEGCSTPLGLADADQVSRLNIAGAVSMAMLAKEAGSAFAVTWRMHDNTMVDLDADQMIGLGVAVGEFISACYAASFAVKDAIAAADSVTAITAVDVTSGYPA